MSEVCIGSASTVRPPSLPLFVSFCFAVVGCVSHFFALLHTQGSEASDPWRKALVGDPDKDRDKVNGTGVDVFADVKPVV